MPKLPEAIYGTWQNDTERTLAEIKRHARPNHPKIREFDAPENWIPLSITYSTDSVLYAYRGERVSARWRILACDEFSLVSEVETTWVIHLPGILHQDRRGATDGRDLKHGHRPAEDCAICSPCPISRCPFPRP